MYALINTLTLLLLISSPVQATWIDDQFAAIAAIQENIPAGCAEKDSEAGGTAGNENAFRYATSDYWATTFTPTASYTVCQIDMPSGVIGTPTMNVTACIYDYAGGTPTTVIDCSTAIAAGANLSFTDGLAAPVTSGTTYALVVYADAVNADNYVYFPYVATASNIDYYDDDGAGTWTAQAGDRHMKYTVYGQ